MSLHAKPTDEVLFRIAAQKRAASISSLIIALLLMTLVGLILFIISMAMDAKAIPTQVTYTTSAEKDKVVVINKVNVQLMRKPTPPGGGSPSKVIAATTTSPVSVPIAIETTVDSSFGMDEGFGVGDGTGFGNGGNYGNIPAPPGKRCNTTDRLQRLASTGGTRECEDAVVKALRYLQKTQNKDGSWHNKSKVGITGLALLAYLGHCETPVSEEFGDTVFRATVYLVDKAMKNKGRLFHDSKGLWCYEHAIATYALCECYTFSKAFGYNIPNLDKATQDAVQWIINTQNPVGGWNYQYQESSRWDTSTTAWHLQALKAAQATGLDFKNMHGVIKKGLVSLTDTQVKSGGFGYSKTSAGSQNGSHYALTGAGTLCLQQHKGKGSIDARKGIRYIEQHSTFNFKKKVNYYEHYYASQAMLNAGGTAWKKYNKMFRDPLLKNQKKDGSWPQPPGNHHSAGTIYNTCLATLMLEVYYRYLPGTGK
jgi:hypothetical protein